MILSDREGLILLERERIRIEPRPDLSAWSSTAVDLRLGSEIRQWKKFEADPKVGGQPMVFCPGVPDFNVNELTEKYTDRVTISEGSPFDIAPGQFILGWTIENISLPDDSRVAARVEGKSSLARLGLGIHITAPTIHGGFGAAKGSKGLTIQLEIWNAGPCPIRLVPGIRICQLIFEEVHGTPTKGYSGQFASQGPKAG